MSTGGYAHLADETLRMAAEKLSAETVSILGIIAHGHGLFD
jgi:hypothetical protein